MNQQRRNIFFFFIALAVAAAIPMNVRAYHIDTHAFLTNETFNLYNENFDEKLPEEFRSFLIDGARKEDDAPRWMNHFYDPVKNRGLSYDPSINPDVVFGDWQTSKEWVKDRDSQNKPTYKVPTAIASILTAIQRWKISELTTKTDFTWQEAIRHYVNGDNEKAFFTLGHVLHLIHDASVPAHTRNDAHAGGDPYETFAKKYTLSTPDNDLRARILEKDGVSYETLSDYFENLAIYSNSNFYSEDTIGIQSGYSEPSVDTENFERKNGLFYLVKKDNEGNYYFLFVKKSLKNLLLDDSLNTKIDDVVKNSYWSILSTKSVQYSAGVIDLFFKEAEKAKNDPNFEREEEKSFLGKLVDVVTFGVQEIGVAVGDIFSKTENRDGPVIQNPPTVPELESEKIEDEKTDILQEEEVFQEGDEKSQISEDELDEYTINLLVTTDEYKEDEKEKKENEVPDEYTEEAKSVRFCIFNANKTTKEKTVILNEVAWMGTEEGYAKEWFELKNISKRDISLGGWQILDYDNGIKINIPENLVIRPDTFLLFERSSDDTVPEEAADIIYTGNLSNDGTKKTEGLRLFDDSCVVQDEVLAVPWWPAGDNKEKRTMERDNDGVRWYTSSVIGGTPKKENSEEYLPSVGGGTVSPQGPKYFSVDINEIFYDAQGSDAGKEWIEIKNNDIETIDFEKWKFYENETNHSLSLIQGSFSLAPGEFAIIADDADTFLLENPLFSGNLFDSAFSLSNDGELLVLKNETLVIDSMSYASSTGAYGDGNSLQDIDGIWQPAFPTPGKNNTLPNQFPIVSFSLTPSEPIVGSFVYFEASSSDADGTVDEFYWDFGDGMNETTTSATVSHAYALEGLYEILLSAMDNNGAVSSSSKTVYVSSSSTQAVPADHIVISETLFRNSSGMHGEFVELYNPTDTTLNLNDWSIRYFVGNATTSNSLGVLNDTSDSVLIPPKGFLLLGINDYTASNFSGIEPDVVRASYSLPDSSEWISIALFDASGFEIDRMRYTEQSANVGESLERKTVFQDACTDATGNQEFEGNTCDRGSDGDFAVRSVPRPQNTSSLQEPRGRLSPVSPVVGMSSTVSFNKETMKLFFEWSVSTSSDSVGTVTYTIQDKSDVDVLFDTITTIASSSDISIQEVGRTYTFEMYASDAEAYESEKREYSIFVPGFFEDAYIYQDPRNENVYLIEMYWDNLPFIPQIYGYDAWQGLVFYKSQDANAENEYLATSNTHEPENISGTFSILRPSCVSGDIESSAHAIIFPLSSEWCSATGGLHAEAFPWERMEDNHIILKVASSTAELSLSESDYMTIAYYDLSDTGGGRQDLRIVATDKTKYFFQNDVPIHASPVLNGSIQTTFSESESKLMLTLPQKSDEDSLDKDVVYELNFSPNTTSTLDDALWNTTTTVSEYEKSVAPEDAFLIGVRAKDDFGNLSDVATTTWEYPSTQFPIMQTNTDGWSGQFGTVMFSSNEPDTASFQGFIPEENFSFDTVVVKVKQETVSDVTTLRLSVLGSVGTTTPDFANIMAETTLDNLLNPSPDEEKTFAFPSPINVVTGNTYWLVLDVAGYSDSRGYTRNVWKNAVMSGGEAYQNGIAGSGHYRGKNAACSDTVLCDFTPNTSTDWYMKIGTREE